MSIISTIVIVSIADSMATAEATGALSRLSQQVDSKAEEARDKGRRMLEHRAQYAGVRARLQTLGDTLRHRVMVPVTSNAFLPATLVHTNEVLVLLGDNWFVETSAKKAAEIAGRRIKACDDILDNLEKELELVEGWRKQTKMFGQEKEECVEINEDFDDVKEKEWKLKHAENVRKERSSQNQTTKSDDDLWQRLEELEVQEAFEKEWDEEDEDEDEDESENEDDDADVQKHKEVDESQKMQEALQREWSEAVNNQSASSQPHSEAQEDESGDDFEEYIEDDESESELTTDNISSGSDNESDLKLLQKKYEEHKQKLLKNDADIKSKNCCLEKSIKRRVSWVEPKDPKSSAVLDPMNTITFKHSQESESTDGAIVGNPSDPQTPSDLLHFACKQPKSILKTTDHDILVRDVELESEKTTEHENLVRKVKPNYVGRLDDSERVMKRESGHEAVQDVIKERDISETVKEESEPEVRKVSKFKAARLKNKQS